MLRGEALARAIAEREPRDRDRFVDDLLALETPETTPAVDPDPELIDYLPSGVSAIAAAILEARVGADDVFCDVGSGTGRVAILVHLLTGARVIGIERDGALVDVARRGVARLGLEGITFVHDDARRTDLTADVFYLYLPCVGTALREVIRRLEVVAGVRPIRIATLGVLLRDQPWLRAADTGSLWLDVYESNDVLQTRRSPVETLPSLAVIADERSRAADRGD